MLALEREKILLRKREEEEETREKKENPAGENSHTGLAAITGTGTERDMIEHVVVILVYASTRKFERTR